MDKNKEYNHIKHQLEDNHDLFLEILNGIDGSDLLPKSMHMNMPAINSKYGSLDALITSYKDRGIKSYQMQLFKKNGKVMVRDGLAYHLQADQPIRREPQTESYQGLMAPGIPQMIDLHVDKRMLEKITQELEVSKGQLKDLEATNKALREEKERLKTSYDNKKFITEMVSRAAPALNGLLGLFSQGGGGLQGAEPQDMPTGLAADLINHIKTTPLDDQTLMLTFQVLNLDGNKQQQVINLIQNNDSLRNQSAMPQNGTA